MSGDILNALLAEYVVDVTDDRGELDVLVRHVPCNKLIPSTSTFHWDSRFTLNDLMVACLAHHNEHLAEADTSGTTEASET